MSSRGHKMVVVFLYIFFSQVKNPLDPENYIVFQDILLIGQVCVKQGRVFNVVHVLDYCENILGNTCLLYWNPKQEKCVEDWPEDSPQLNPDFRPVRKLKTNVLSVQSLCADSGFIYPPPPPRLDH